MLHVRALAHVRVSKVRVTAIRRAAGVSVVLVASCIGMVAQASAETTPPTASLNGLVPITNSQYQKVIGSSIFVNTAQTGSFRVDIDATDNAAVSFVQFPDLDGSATLWTRTPSNGLDTTPSGAAVPPTTYQMIYSWAVGAISPGTVTAFARDSSANTTNVNFTVIGDGIGPTSTLDYLDGPNKNNSVAISFLPADAGSGLATWQLQRRSASYSGGSCGTWSAWGNIGAALIASPYSDSTLADATCYQYRISATDRVANTSLISISKTVKVDKSAPTASISGFGETGNDLLQHTVGNIHYYNGAYAGSVQVQAAAIDNVSGVSRIEFPSGEDASWLAPGVDYSAPYQGEYHWNPNASYFGTRNATVYDEAGNLANISVTLLPDGDAPTGSSISYTDGATSSASASVTFTVGSDALTGIAQSQLQRQEATYFGGSCGTFGAWMAIDSINPTSPVTDTSLADNTCYRYRLEVRDNVDNVEYATSANVVRVDQTNFSYPTGYRTSLSIPITVDAGSHGGADISSWQLQRRSASYGVDNCDTYSAWTDRGVPDLDGVYTDTSLVNGTCYEYRLVLVDSLAAQTIVSGLGDVRVDTVAPTISMSTVGPLAGASAVVQGAASDAASTVQRVGITYTGPASASGTICTSAADPANYSCAWNTLLLADGMYTVTATAYDRAGNTNTVVRSIMIDNTGPAVSLHSITPVTGTSYQYISGTTIYVNGNQEGSFSFRVNASDTVSGIGHVDFPDLDGPAQIIWSPIGLSSIESSPYTVTYGWSPGAASPGAKTVTVYDGSGVTAAFAFAVHVDSNAPLNATTTHASGLSKLAAAQVTFTTGTDGGAGVDTSAVQVQRRAASYAATSCGAYGAWSNVGSAGVSSPYSDATIGAANCYQYRVLVPDRVGNVRTVTPVGTPVLRVDRTNPTGTVSAAPAGTVSGSVNITGTADDGESGINAVAVTYTGPESGTVCPSAATPASWSCSWNTSALADGTYTLNVVATDVAGNTATVATRLIDVDNNGPAVSVTGFVEGTNPGGQMSSGTTMYINPAQSGSFTVEADASDGLGITQIAFADPLLPNWGGGGVDSSGPAPFTAAYSWTAGAGNAADVGVTATDTSGFATTVTFDVVTDSTAPSIALSSPTAVFDLDGAITPAWSGSDPGGGAGNVRFTVERAFAPISATLGEWSAWSSATATASLNATMTGATPGTWCFRAVAVDGVGNTSAASPQRCSAIPRDDDVFTATGAWQRVVSASAFGQDYRQSTAAAASLRTTVSGKQVSLLVTRCKGCGTVDVFLGTTRLKNDLSLAATSTRRQQLVPIFAGAATRSGVLKIVSNGTGPVYIEGLAVSAV